MDTELLEVLSVNDSYFIEQSICDNNKVGDNNVYTFKDNKVYYKVTPEEISSVCFNMKTSFNITNEALQVYVVVPDEEPDHEFDVCCYEDRYFVDQSILQKFHIRPMDVKVKVDGNYYFEVSPQQIAIIEGSSLYGVWKANYRKIVSNQ